MNWEYLSESVKVTAQFDWNTFSYYNPNATFICWIDIIFNKLIFFGSAVQAQNHLFKMELETKELAPKHISKS